jgi:hypothetical protein
MMDVGETAAVMNGIVSAIIPVRGAADTIGGLVREVRAQAPQGHEVDVVVVMLPVMFSARLAHSAGLAAGGIRWIRYGTEAPEARSRWE